MAPVRRRAHGLVVRRLLPWLCLVAFTACGNQTGREPEKHPSGAAVERFARVMTRVTQLERFRLVGKPGPSVIDYLARDRVRSVSGPGLRNTVLLLIGKKAYLSFDGANGPFVVRPVPQTTAKTALQDVGLTHPTQVEWRGGAFLVQLSAQKNLPPGLATVTVSHGMPDSIVITQRINNKPVRLLYRFRYHASIPPIEPPPPRLIQ